MVFYLQEISFTDVHLEGLDNDGITDIILNIFPSAISMCDVCAKSRTFDPGQLLFLHSAV